MIEYTLDQKANALVVAVLNQLSVIGTNLKQLLEKGNGEVSSELFQSKFSEEQLAEVKRISDYFVSQDTGAEQVQPVPVAAPSFEPAVE